jgi:hypothetical protein
MEAGRFAALLRSLSASPSRRSAVRLLAGLVLGSPLALDDNAAAHNALKKCKKIDDKAKRKKCVKKAKAHNATHLIQPPPPPPPTATVRCDAFTGDTPRRRVAQTFIAPLSGTPTRGEVVVTNNPDNLVLQFDVRTVDESGFPSSVVLASGVVANIPQTQVGDPPRRVVASLTNVVSPLVAGQPYALAVTGSSTWSTQVTNTAAGGDPCLGGKVFFDDDDSGPFSADNAYTDMVFALTITS